MAYLVATVGIFRQFSPIRPLSRPSTWISAALLPERPLLGSAGSPSRRGQPYLRLHGCFQLTFVATPVLEMLASDSTLASRIDQAIQTNPYVNGRTLRFETDGSRVVLQGSVRSYFQKQMAQEAIRKVDGVEQIENCLEVLWV